jgi:hypothetical protein
MLKEFPAWIDSSAISEFRTCEMRDFYGRKHKLASVRPNVHLLAGGAFAKALEVTRRQFFLAKMPPEDAVACGLEALWSAYGPDADLPEDNPKSCSVIANALVAYFDKYPLSTDFVRPITVEGALTVEFSFSFPLSVKHPVSGLPILYTGRCDAIADYRGQLFTCDEKTTSRLGDSWPAKWPLRGQFIGYNHGCHQNGLPVVGTIVRGVAVRKSGEVDFAEALIFHPQWMVDRWLEQTELTVARMVAAWESGQWAYNFGYACEGCTFNRLCTTPDWQTFREPYFKENSWNPLTLPEPLLRH